MTAEVRRCDECGGLIALIDPTPRIISLHMEWVHITKFGKVKRRVNHQPAVSDPSTPPMWIEQVRL